jgi:TetR/AcrR family transcriptional repressor of mexJK operon
MAALRLLTTPEVIAMHRVVIGDAGKNPKVARLMYEAGPQRVLEDLAELLTAWRERGLVQMQDVRSAADHFLFMLRGDMQFRVLLNIRPRPTEAEMQRHVDDCVDTFLRAFGAR